MKSRNHFPALDQTCEAFARAVASADSSAATAFFSNATESADAAIAKILAHGPADRVEELGRARLGFQYISKFRISSGERVATIICRWRDENGAWRIAEIEDLTGKRSAWSDLTIAVPGESNA